MPVETYSNQKSGASFLSPHFQVKEFRCKDGSDTVRIHTELISALERLFDYLGCSAINIISGYRTDSHSIAVGGYAGDQHTLGNAADIQCKVNGKVIDAKTICCALEDMGHNGGVGYISATNVHVDVRGRTVYFDETRGERTTNSWHDYFGIARPAQPGAVKVGDVVDFLGGFHYASANAASPAGGVRKAGKARVTIVKEGAKHPYHVIHVSGGGSNVYGWVDSNTIG